jgi:arylformamidase
MKIFDISMAIHEGMPVWGNNEHKKPKFKVNVNYQLNDIYETSVYMDMHIGTHIDAPLHMIKEDTTIDGYNLNQFISKCRVIDFTDVKDKITKEDLITKDIKPNEFILFKTNNSAVEIFEDDFVYLDRSGASYLVEIGVSGVGTDGLGIERDQKDFATHISLLSKDIMIIEGLRLKNIKEGPYLLIALPLKIKNVEAAPCRAVLVEINSLK